MAGRLSRMIRHIRQTVQNSRHRCLAPSNRIYQPQLRCLDRADTRCHFSVSSKSKEPLNNPSNPPSSEPDSSSSDVSTAFKLLLKPLCSLVNPSITSTSCS